MGTNTIIISVGKKKSIDMKKFLNAVRELFENGECAEQKLLPVYNR